MVRVDGHRKKSGDDGRQTCYGKASNGNMLFPIGFVCICFEIFKVIRFKLRFCVLICLIKKLMFLFSLKIYPSENQLNAIERLVVMTEKGLKEVSDHFAKEYGFYFYSLNLLIKMIFASPPSFIPLLSLFLIFPVFFFFFFFFKAVRNGILV